jgi:hypothetical protein
MSLHLRPVRIATGSRDDESELVFDDDRLVAVLVRLSNEHGHEAGMWFLEAGFGPVADPAPPKFADLNEAQVWIQQQLTPAS